MNFYYLSHNTHTHPRGKPWILTARAARSPASRCNLCGLYYVQGVTDKIALELDPQKGTRWTDVLGCGGGVAGLFVSERVRGEFERVGLRYGEAFPAEISHIPSRMKDLPPPRYYLLSGEKGARFDFDSSGLKVKSVCSQCGLVTLDQSFVASKYQLKEETWNGSDIFYTDVSPTAYFCSERVLELARVHKWSNFRFVPLEEACNYSYKGIKYM